MKQRQENADRQQRRDRSILSVYRKGMEFEKLEEMQNRELV